MNTKVKTHASLAAAIALPILFILILALVIMIPQSRIKPQHDFVYTTTEYETGAGYGMPIQYRNVYEVVAGKIVLVPVDQPLVKDAYERFVTKDALKMYYYDMSEQTSREISFDDARQLALDAGPSSPDGYTVKYDYYNDGIFELFGSDSSRSNFLISKGDTQKELHGIAGNGTRYYGGEDFRLIGWVK